MVMFAEKPKIKITGKVTHPTDLVAAARKDLTEDQVEGLINQHGENFTAKQLVEYIEERR